MTEFNQIVTKIKNIDWRLEALPEEVFRINRVLQYINEDESDWSKFMRLWIEAIYEEKDE